jgi:hypothetical protein
MANVTRNGLARRSANEAHCRGSWHQIEQRAWSRLDIVMHWASQRHTSDFSVTVVAVASLCSGGPRERRRGLAQTNLEPRVGAVREIAIEVPLIVLCV